MWYPPLRPKSTWEESFHKVWFSPFLLVLFFFLSTTLFCWGVLGAEKLCPIPSSSKYLVKDSFSSFLPWSVLMFEIVSHLSFLSRRHNFVNEKNASFLLVKSITQVNREKSSTTTCIVFRQDLMFLTDLLNPCVELVMV